METKGKIKSGDIVRLAAQFDSTSQVLADITTGFTHYVEAGKKYTIRILLHVDSSSSSGHSYAIGGTATATSIIGSLVGSCLSTTSELGKLVFYLAYRIIALNLSVSNMTGGTSKFMIQIEGDIVVNAAGTLTVQVARTNSAGTVSILPGSVFEIIEED